MDVADVDGKQAGHRTRCTLAIHLYRGSFVLWDVVSPETLASIATATLSTITRPFGWSLVVLTALFLIFSISSPSGGLAASSSATTRRSRILDDLMGLHDVQRGHVDGLLLGLVDFLGALRGVFIVRISCDRTIREFAIGVLMILSAVTFVWFTIMGGAALHSELIRPAG